MMIQRLTHGVVLLAAVLAMGTGVTKAQEKVRIAVPSPTIVNMTSARLTVTGVTVSALAFENQCMADAGFGGLKQGRNLVAIDHNYSPAATLLTAYHSKAIPAGARLVNLTLVAVCAEPGATYWVSECDIANSHGIDMVLVTTPAGITLDGGHEVVITVKGQNEGITNAVFVKKKQGAIKSPIISDVPLEPGDRLTDFLEVDFDPETGETTHACWLEY